MIDEFSGSMQLPCAKYVSRERSERRNRNVDYPLMSAHATTLTATDVGSAKIDVPRAPSWWIVAVLSIAVIALAHLLDEWAWTHLRDPQVYERDWGRMLRSAGYLPTWLVVAIALWGQDRGRAGWGWRGGLMILTPTLSGALAELLKLVVRRLRPPDITAQFGYAFRSFGEKTWSTGGLGMPSSHVLVAVGAATVLARLFPRVWWLWYLVAAGCAYTRLLANAHYLSDVVAAAVLGWITAELCVRFVARKLDGLAG